MSVASCKSMEGALNLSEMKESHAEFLLHLGRFEHFNLLVHIDPYWKLTILFSML